jgi:hypothetical protein
MLRMPAPREQLLRRQSVPPCHHGNGFPAVAFGNNSLLLLGAPRAPAASSGENLKPPHRLRLGLGQKLSVRHVSNPNRPSIRLDNRRSLLGLEGGERRPLSLLQSQGKGNGSRSGLRNGEDLPGGLPNQVCPEASAKRDQKRDRKQYSFVEQL